MILIALAFWGWMWGISGMILAVPILATFKIFCDHIERLAALGNDNGNSRSDGMRSA